jgi:hypothetical protein
MPVFHHDQSGVDPRAHLPLQRLSHTTRRLPGPDHHQSLMLRKRIALRTDGELPAPEADLTAHRRVRIDGLESRTKQCCRRGLVP